MARHVTSSRLARHVTSAAPPEVAALRAQVSALEERIKLLESLVAPSSAMRYRTLGATDMRVSVLSLGCAGLGGVYGDVNQSQANELVLAALRRGVNFFDTSPYYGDTQSETVLGRALRHAIDTGEFAREDMYVATKVGRYGDGTDFSAARIKSSLQESCDRLQLDTIDLIQCHDVEFASSLEQVVEEALPSLEEARGAGTVSHVGITGLPLSVLDFVVGKYQGKIDSILTYCCYTLNNTGLSEYLPRWRHGGIGVVQGGATSMGLLTPGGPQDWHPAPAEVRKACNEAVQLCERLGEDIVKLAFQYTFAEQEIASVLVAPPTPEALATNIHWLEQPLDSDLAADVQAVLAPIRNRMWVEKGSEENIALASGGFWAEGHGTTNVIDGSSTNLG